MFGFSLCPLVPTTVFPLNTHRNRRLRIISEYDNSTCAMLATKAVAKKDQIKTGKPRFGVGLHRRQMPCKVVVSHGWEGLSGFNA